MFEHPNPQRPPAGPGGAINVLAAALLTATLAVPAAHAGTVDSGSDGSDQALNLTTITPITIVVRRGAPPVGQGARDGYLDRNGDGEYNFTSVNIGKGVTLKFSSEFLGSEPIVWKVQGDVLLNGKLDFDGEAGGDWNGDRVAAHGGAGGYNGGLAGRADDPGTNGSGPGAGHYRTDSGRYRGSSAGHAANGSGNNPGIAYGNVYLLPLIGGSGGGGGYHSNTHNSGGGGGGGAILIISGTRITIGDPDNEDVQDDPASSGISARGGPAGNNNHSDWYGSGGGGSGGAIRIIATVIDGIGGLSVEGGATSDSYRGSGGRIRLETFDNQFTGTSGGSGTMRVTTPGNPVVLELPESAPSVRVLSVNGVAVPAPSRGAYDPPDLDIETAGEVPFVVQAKNVPTDRLLTLTLTMEGEGGQRETHTETNIDPQGSSTVTKEMNVTVPHGFSRYFVEANWDN